MATTADSQAVNSLNNSGKKKFVFKNFSQSISDIDIEVYRSLDKVKAEPSFEEQGERVIEEILALEAAKVAKKDDYDDASRVSMGSMTSVLEGGKDTAHANVGGDSSGMCTVPPTKIEWLKKCDNNTKDLELELP